MLSLGLTPVKGLTIEANTFGVGLYCGNLIADFFEFFDVYDFSLFVTCGLSAGIFGHTGTNVGGGLKIRLDKRIAFRFEIRSFDVGSSYKKTSLIAFRILL